MGKAKIIDSSADCPASSPFDSNPEAQARAAETRARHAKAINARCVIRERREQGQIADKAHAIRNHCLECVGYNNEEVKLCTSVRCWLYPWRLGHLDEECVE